MICVVRGRTLKYRVVIELWNFSWSILIILTEKKLSFVLRKLSNNPYNCDCSMVWFIRELNKKGKYIRDLESLRCAQPKKLSKKKIVDLAEKDVCPTGWVAIWSFLMSYLHGMHFFSTRDHNKIYEDKLLFVFLKQFFYNVFESVAQLCF